MKLDTKDYEAKMKKTISSYSENLSTIRAGRANPDVLKKINVDYYGSPTPISSIAEIKVTDARTIMITAWDKSIIKGIEKAILTSDLGINPQSDGSAIRLSFPPTTEERRKELSKQISKLGEDAKVAIRNIRRDANDAFKKLAKEDVSEDEIKDLENEIQKLTDKYIKDIEKAVDEKSKEILTV